MFHGSQGPRGKGRPAVLMPQPLKAGRRLSESLRCPERCGERGLQGSFLRDPEELPGWLGLL